MATVADVWRPTSELEHRLQETVRAGDQESYFRLIADSELLIPVPPDLVDGMLAGEAQPTWPTQEEDGRVHVLAYTSASAMRACLGPSYQHFMTVRFGEIAESWPDNRWWLAIDAPARGVAAALPIEARLPAWFVRQVAEGDGRPPQVGRAPAPWEELRDQHRELPREKSRQEFQPANDVERELLRAAANNDHDLFLQTLAATDVLLPVPDGTDYTMRPGRPGFPWQTREVDGSTVVPVFTSPERLVEAARAAGTGSEYIKLPFNVALRYWPDHDWPLAVNSGSPAGGTVLAQQLPGLAAWADQRAAQRRTDGFEPQNDVEGRLFEAARRRDTDGFFKILLGAQVLVPADPDTPWGIAPGEPGFPWRPVTVHGRRSIQVFTSLKWLNEAVGSSRFIMPTLLDMVAAWPDTDWDLVLNPGTPIDATMPGDKVRSLGGARAAERATPPAAAAPAPPDAPAVPVAPPVPDAAGRGGPGDAPGGPGAGSGTGPAAPDAPAEPVGADLPAERPAATHPGPQPPAGPSGAPDAPPAPAQGPNPQQPVRASDPGSTATDPPAGQPGLGQAAEHAAPAPPPGPPEGPQGHPGGGPAMPAPQASATSGPQGGTGPQPMPDAMSPEASPEAGRPGLPGGQDMAASGQPGGTGPQALPGGASPEPARRPDAHTDHGPAGMPEARPGGPGMPAPQAPAGPGPQGGTGPQPMPGGTPAEPAGQPHPAADHAANGAPEGRHGAPAAPEPQSAAGRPGGTGPLDLPGATPHEPTGPPGIAADRPAGAADHGRAGPPEGQGVPGPGRPGGPEPQAVPGGTGPQPVADPGPAEPIAPGADHGAGGAEHGPAGAPGVAGSGHPGGPPARDVPDHTPAEPAGRPGIAAEQGADHAAAAAQGGAPAMRPAGEAEPAFEPGNRIDQELYDAALSGDSDAFLRVLLNANVLVPIPGDAPLEVTPVQREFRWDAALRTESAVQVFTSLVRLREVLPESRFVYADFRELIGAWPREDWTMLLNPGTRIGASLQGDQVRALSEWAVRVGLVPARPEVPLPPPRPEPAPQPEPADPDDRVPSPTIMQKVVPHGHVSWYLEQGYDRVGGFVHSTADVAELQTPIQLYEALGLLYEGSPFSPGDEGVYVIRWPAYCPDLYRIPFGGRDEEEMAAWGEAGWVIERPPFAGNGFAPGSAGSIREYKVDSVRLPFGAEMYYLGRDRSERFIAMYDPDRLAWLRPDASAEAWNGRTEAAQ